MGPIVELESPVAALDEDSAPLVRFKTDESVVELTSSTESTVKKSRFVVDNDDSVKKVDQVIPIQPIKPEVKKGRFSVIDGNDNISSAQKTVISSPNTSQQIATSPNMLDNGSDNQNQSQESLKKKNTERKGRFAVNDLQQQYSPDMKPTEGPRVPRKFTIVESNSTASTPSTTSASSSLERTKKSRFEIVDYHESEIVPNLSKALGEIPDLPPMEMLTYLQKQVMLQKAVIRDLLAVCLKEKRVVIEDTIIQRENSSEYVGAEAKENAK